MRIKNLPALLLSALFAATLPTASAAEVYFENSSQLGELVDVYVDGRLVFDDVFPSSFPLFPQNVTRGLHEVVITPSALAPGQQDVLRSTVNVAEDGTYTLALLDDEDTQGLPALQLALTPGIGAEE
ncbi:DUF4397 domain-containing protein [Deinococcus sp. YIM 77859]|uniref:DUF4397 domain-containing protein n=1 Tax=Deinococcus sp. YIM 77859 TaxID=1540221 RepID=UPI00068FBED3|nr:DUF4397 domain-containing protein [Deinococcus sp. YIM 77859]